MRTQGIACIALLFLGCGNSGGTGDGGMDGGTTCQFEPLPATAHAGGKVQAGPVQVGAAELYLDLPVTTALGGYTARATPVADYGNVDRRTAEMSGSFTPSVGIETSPKVKAVAITAGEETIVVIGVDLIFADASITADVAAALGPEYAGKVVFATSHSHSSWGQYSTNSALAVGVGRFRERNYRGLVQRMTEVGKAALAARKPAKIGVGVETKFDPMDEVSGDRRGENDKLPGGNRKDDFLAVIRADALDGTPIAVLDVFGVHGIVLDADNPLATTDAPGAIARAVEEEFDRKVVVIHLQGAAGDASPRGHGGTDRGKPGEDVAYFDFARSENVGRAAAKQIMPVWQRAGMDMKDQLAMEMVSRVVPLGPDPKTFKVREGRGTPLEYAPWDLERACDGKIFGGAGEVLSPIDEFNAPNGAALCGDPKRGALFEDSALNGVVDGPYLSCTRIEAATKIFEGLLRLPKFEPMPVCASTRTMVSAIRLGDYMIAAVPGEPLVMYADLLRKLSPVAPEKTIVVGYSQGHIGYVLTAEDWLQGGYEPSINFWGPLEGEYVAERLQEMMKLAMTDDREDAAKGGVDRMLMPTPPDDVPAADAAPMAGQVPGSVPDKIVMRRHFHPTSAQPDAKVPRVTGSARFVWIGEDPLGGTPRVTLQRETAPGQFGDVVRRSGRPVQDGDLLVIWTPDPLFRKAPQPRTHYWAVEWQAVSVWGTVAAPDLEDRAGVALGKYRFHVEGTGYKVDSAPFEVVAGPLTVAAQVMGSMVTVDAAYEATTGWRSIDPALPSNGKVPVARGPVDVELTFDDGKMQQFPQVALMGPGKVVVDAGMGKVVVGVKVTDRFGNSGSGKP